MGVCGGGGGSTLLWTLQGVLRGWNLKACAVDQVYNLDMSCQATSFGLIPVHRAQFICKC